ncbi:MAG: phosphoribosylglycinamide formyltransferase, partial [Candidatus Thiodiazotropha sp. (ex Dulcina madagascariensis)]|nr:phosphoribosylglycinamide formyltransferase [Candidatus Thiodiazotropha sp. (ex Dulcina madagascariensis)]
FVRHYAGRLLNIHPSLLPNYTGLHTHQRVLDAGDRLHGATIHFVTEKLDGGPSIVQAQVVVEAGDDADGLAARVLEKEHQIYPLAIRWFAEDRLVMDENGEVWLDDKKLDRPVLLSPQEPIG